MALYAEQIPFLVGVRVAPLSLAHVPKKLEDGPVGFEDGLDVGFLVGTVDGFIDGLVGFADGLNDGTEVGFFNGNLEGFPFSVLVGTEVGFTDEGPLLLGGGLL